MVILKVVSMAAQTTVSTVDRHAERNLLKEGHQ
jgi:hypothetical protein